MRLSEVLRFGYPGIPSIHRKRGRVSLEDLREVEALRAKAQPSCRSGLAGLQEKSTEASYGAALGSPRITPSQRTSLNHPILGVASPDQGLGSSSEHSSSAPTGVAEHASTTGAAAAEGTFTPQQSPLSYAEISVRTPGQHAAPPSHTCSSAHAAQNQVKQQLTVIQGTGSQQQQLHAPRQQQPGEQQHPLPQSTHHHPQLQQQHAHHHHLHNHNQQQRSATLQLQHQQQHQDGSAAVANTHQDHPPHNPQLPGGIPLQALQLPGWRELQAVQAGLLGLDSDSDALGSDSDSEDYEQSEGTSDFEDAYSDYGTTEEEEENNSIPPADLEAILAENAKQWGQQHPAAAGGEQQG